MKKALKKGDLILLLVILLICAAGFVFINFFVPSGNTVAVYVNNELAASMSLNKNDQYDVADGNKTINTVVVEDGCVFIRYADCPDQICKNHKKISKVGESILCLPNKVVVKIESDNSDVEIDGVVR